MTTILISIALIVLLGIPLVMLQVEKDKLKQSQEEVRMLDCSLSALDSALRKTKVDAIEAIGKTLDENERLKGKMRLICATIRKVKGRAGKHHYNF